MINKLSLKELPYSIGIPDEGQQRIRWIQNGDCMTAASTKFCNIFKFCFSFFSSTT